MYQIEHPPSKIVAPRFRLAWPIGLVTAGNARLGFLMPGAFPNSIPLEELIVPTLAPNVAQSFRDKFDLEQPVALFNRMKVGINICAALQMFYSGGEYRIIDMKPSNILITSGGDITLVDLDSIQILERGSVKFEGVDGTDRYKPPEGLGDTIDPFDKNIHWDEFSLAIILYQIMVGAPPHAASFGGAFAQCTEMRDKIRAGLFVFGRHESLITHRSPLHDTFKRLPTEVRQLFHLALDQGHDNPSLRPSVVDWGGSVHRAVNLLESQFKIQSRARNPVSQFPFPGLAVIAAYKSVLASARQRWRAILLITAGLVGFFLLRINTSQNPPQVYHQPRSDGPTTADPTQQPGSVSRSPPSPQQTTPQPTYVAPPPGYEWIDPSRGLKRWVPGSAYGSRWPHVVASDEEGKWEAEPGYEFQNNVKGEYSVRPVLEPTTSSYDRGLADRTGWEQWFAGLSGDFQAGAYWWSAERSLATPGACNSPAATQQFVRGCEAARARLAPTDAKRKYDREYKRGWNAYAGSVGQGQNASVDSATFEQGQADRTAWEHWFAGLSGDFQAGAYWWSGQRSLANPGTCNATAATQLFVAGCEAAMSRLTPTDLKRKLSVEYRRGWNEYSGPVVQPQISDPAPNVTQLNGDPDVGAADRLNSQELKRLIPR
jgi:serine/threonine protein kinase